jgi:hypothetical protein
MLKAAIPKSMIAAKRGSVKSKAPSNQKPLSQWGSEIEKGHAKSDIVRNAHEVDDVRSEVVTNIDMAWPSYFSTLFASTHPKTKEPVTVAIHTAGITVSGGVGAGYDVEQWGWASIDAVTVDPNGDFSILTNVAAKKAGDQQHAFKPTLDIEVAYFADLAMRVKAASA